MRKKYELWLENTCINQAHHEEMVFVLLGRDPAAPHAIRTWITKRIHLRKNIASDALIIDAHAIADVMEREGRKWVNAPKAATFDDHVTLRRRVAELEAAVARMAPVVAAVERWHNGDNSDQPKAVADIVDAIDLYQERAA